MSLSRKHKVVIDTNIFISGLLFGGNPEKILRLFQQSKIELLISPETQAELVEKLSNFPLESKTLQELLILIEEKAIKIIPKKRIRISRDIKDNIFLEVASEGSADYIISGDRDLLTLQRVGKTVIIAPREFLDNLRK